MTEKDILRERDSVYVCVIERKTEKKRKDREGVKQESKRERGRKFLYLCFRCKSRSAVPAVHVQTDTRNN